MAVATAVESVAVGLAAGGGYRGHSAQGCECGFGVQSVGVVAAGGQQLGGCLHADTFDGQ
jgi:hypothetical protein